VKHAYRPIDCSLHDRIEDLATTGTRVAIVFEDEHGQARQTNDAIRDWFVRDGAEFLQTMSGVEIRLDRLVSVGGVLYRQ
jgi:transcriptional antiterminator Rof (Rho-off)